MVPEPAWAHGVLNVQDSIAVATEVYGNMWRQIEPAIKESKVFTTHMKGHGGGPRGGGPRGGGGGGPRGGGDRSRRRPPRHAPAAPSGDRHEGRFHGRRPRPTAAAGATHGAA